MDPETAKQRLVDGHGLVMFDHVEETLDGNRQAVNAYRRKMIDGKKEDEPAVWQDEEGDDEMGKRLALNDIIENHHHYHSSPEPKKSSTLAKAAIAAALIASGGGVAAGIPYVLDLLKSRTEAPSVTEPQEHPEVIERHSREWHEIGKPIVRPPQE